MPSALSAQVNPNVLEFLPSADHAARLPNGQSAVLSYELLVYPAGGLDPYLRVGLGKPAPQSDGRIRVNLLTSVLVWPLLNVSSVARVAAVGPSNTSVSTPSNSFSYLGSGSASGAARYLSDLPWSHSSNGWGPVERDLSNGEQGARDGRTITLNGVAYGKGLGAHGPSEIRYPLNGECSAFQAEVGVDDESGTRGSIVFRVLADGVQLFDSGVMTGGSSTRSVQVDISGRRELALLIRDGGDNIDADHGDWANARITCSGAGTSSVFLSDRPWTSMTNGWGPVERDRSNGELGSADGSTLRLNGQTYAKGLGAHASSRIVYALNGACSRFQAEVGIDDESGSAGAVVFEVWGDGTKLFDSGRMTGSTATRSVDVGLTGRNTLTLVIGDAGNGIDADHGNWAAARVTCRPGGF
jgi:hypothetical protein